MNKGLAGYVASNNLSILVDNVLEDNKFNAEVDDPNCPLSHPTKNLMVLPVFSSTDKNVVL